METQDGKQNIGILLTEAYNLLVEISPTDKITNLDKEKSDIVITTIPIDSTTAISEEKENTLEITHAILTVDVLKC